MQDTQSRMRVFVSYSRVDRAFADDLVLGLTACGFEAYIDREDIAAGEEWPKRLAGLIMQADTVVYVISPDSTASPQCAWEVTETLRVSKRLLPVVWRPVEDERVAPELRQLNYVYFSGAGHTFASGLSRLATALRTDVEWIREHTRLGELAARWDGRARTPSLLLRGEELDAARAWSARRPANAPAITDQQADFVKASSDARTEAEARARRARAGLLSAVSVVAIAMTALAAASLLFWRQATVQAGRAEASAREASEAYEATHDLNGELTNANIRLSANIGLRAAPSTSYLDVPGGWFPVAANYSGAVARIERRGPDGTVYEVGSGLLIDGGLVNSDLTGQPLLLVPARLPDGEAALEVPEGETVDFSDPDLGVLRQTRIAGVDPRPEDTSVHFSLPVVAPGNWLPAGKSLWRTPDHLGGVPAFELLPVAEGQTLPEGILPVGEADIACSSPAEDAAGGWVGTLGADAGGSAYAGDRQATLYISSLMSRADPYAIRYDHATNLGAAGAPVFDLSTGQILAIHLDSRPDPERPGRRVGLGLSLPLLLSLPRASLDPKEGRLPPICEAG